MLCNKFVFVVVSVFVVGLVLLELLLVVSDLFVVVCISLSYLLLLLFLLSAFIDPLLASVLDVCALFCYLSSHTLAIFQDVHAKRNRLLVPYNKLSKAAKKSNYDTALESLRTVCGLGCTVTPPTSGGMNINQLMREFSESGSRTRTFRGQKCYKVMDGKWQVHFNGTCAVKLQVPCQLKNLRLTNQMFADITYWLIDWSVNFFTSLEGTIKS